MENSFVTIPSAFAIFALSAITAIVNATDFSGGVFNFEKILAKGSPLASIEMAVVIFVQIDIQKSSL